MRKFTSPNSFSTEQERREKIEICVSFSKLFKLQTQIGIELIRNYVEDVEEQKKNFEFELNFYSFHSLHYFAAATHHE